MLRICLYVSGNAATGSRWVARCAHPNYKDRWVVRRWPLIDRVATKPADREVMAVANALHYYENTYPLDKPAELLVLSPVCIPLVVVSQPDLWRWVRYLQNTEAEFKAAGTQINYGQLTDLKELEARVATEPHDSYRFEV